MADRNIIIEDDKGNRYFPYTKAELVEGAETPSGAQAKADTAEANAKSYAKSYTDQQVATKADIDHKHSAADITSGTLAVARLPAASTSARGIVQLTTSRTSTSDTLALTASAMNSHRTSGDHDDRYYTKAEVDALVGTGGMTWMVPGDTVLATYPETISARREGSDRTGLVVFKVTKPGFYRVTGQFRPYGSSGSGEVFLAVPGPGRTLVAVEEDDDGYIVDEIYSPEGTNLASERVYTTSGSYISFTLDTTIATPAGGFVLVCGIRVDVRYLELKAVPGNEPAASSYKYHVGLYS